MQRCALVRQRLYTKLWSIKEEGGIRHLTPAPMTRKQETKDVCTNDSQSTITLNTA
jgi:hypothetical protein